MRLFLDENLSPAHSLYLRNKGYDAVAVVEVGLSGAPDEDVLHFAVAERRVLVTLDSDFANVIRFPPDATAGIVRLRVHPPAEQKIRACIDRALLLLSNVDLTGRLAVVDEDKIRIR